MCVCVWESWCYCHVSSFSVSECHILVSGTPVWLCSDTRRLSAQTHRECRTEIIGCLALDGGVEEERNTGRRDSREKKVEEERRCMGLEGGTKRSGEQAEQES